MSMANSSRIQRSLNKLESLLDASEFYEAHQLLRTIYFRYKSQKKYFDSIELLYGGIKKFSSHQQMQSATDLSMLFADFLLDVKIPPDSALIEKIGHIHSLMSATSNERLVFRNKAIAWAQEFSTADAHSGRALPSIHSTFANTFWKERSYDDSRYHFVHSNDGTGCASMLVEYHVTRGFRSEVDLFITQVVLQFLCLANGSTAKTTFHHYTQTHPQVKRTDPPFVFPLLNFVWFLLLAIQKKHIASFTVLIEQYQPSICRDPSYTEYLDKIGQIFFGLPPQKSAGPSGLFDNLLQGLLGTSSSQDSEETMTELGVLPKGSSPSPEPSSDVD